MKELKFSDFDCYIFLGERDQNVVEKYLEEEVPLFYDDLGRVFLESGIYIADIEPPFSF